MSEAHALKAAGADMAGLKADVQLITWMLGFLLAFQIAISIKIFGP